MIRRYLLLLLLVTVSAIQVYRECQKEGMIAFTFDQGPSQYTGILLTYLAKANVKATFHISPDYLDNPVISANLRRAASEGHLIGLYVRDSITEGSVKVYLANATSIVKQYINYSPMFLRFPVPGPSEAMLKTVTGLGYKVTSYNLDSMDYNYIGEPTEQNGEGSVYRTIRGILDQIIPPTLGSFICVQRDIVQASVMQMPAILNYTKGRGYKPVKLDTCIGMDAAIPNDTTGEGGGVDGSNPNADGGHLHQASVNSAPHNIISKCLWSLLLLPQLIYSLSDKHQHPRPIGMSGFGLRIPEKKTQKPKVTNLFNVETAKDTDANTNTNTAKDTNTNTAKDTNTNTNVTTKDTNTNVTTKDTKKTSFIPDRHLVETIQQTALEEDPSIFDYDSVYEEVSTDARNKARLIRAPQEGPKYMPAILKAAEERKREQEALKIRKYRKEVTSDDQTFMTAAYKRKLEEMRQKGIEPDKSSDDEEIDRDSRDLSRFHRNIMKRDISSRSREQSPPNKKL